MLRRRFLEFAPAGAALWLGCSSPPASRELKPLRAAAYPRLSMSGLYLAKESGYFEEEGFDVQIERFPDSTHAIALLAGGELDAAFVSPSPALFNALARDAAIRIVAGREIASPSCGTVGSVYGHRGSFPNGLADLSQLAGRSVAASRRMTISEFYLDSLLESVGLSSDDLNIVELPSPEATAAIISGRIDAMVSSYFDRDIESLSDKVVRGIGLADILPNFQYAHVLFGPTFLDAPVEQGASFLTAYLRGARAFRAGETPQFLYDFTKQMSLDPERARRACRQTFDPNGRIDQASLERIGDWCFDKGYCEKRIEVANLIDSRFIDATLAQLGTS